MDKLIRIIETDGIKEYQAIERLRNRDDDSDTQIEKNVADIISEIKKDGDIALEKFEKKFNPHYDNNRAGFEIPHSMLRTAFENGDQKFNDAIIAASSNIRNYHEKQRDKGYEDKSPDGVVIGQVIRGLTRVGLYVPGGTAAYPSTVLMNAIPAKLAGVEELIMVTPNANDQVLSAAYVAGVDRLFFIGGAQAVAALAYGTESIPKVDKIVGPGNAYVAEAKRQLFGQVDIDMIAGPSEILVMADELANPKYIAADMLSQAEHDTMSASVLLTTEKDIATSVESELKKQLEDLERKDIAQESLKNNGLIIICKSDDEMVDLSNEVAPEHLEIMTANPLGFVPMIKNAGSVFCGDFTPEPLGDYYSGTNHVLPTSGTARFASPLGVYDFVKRMSYTYYTEDALKKAKDDIIAIGEVEGLTAHVESVKKRFE